MIHLQPHVQYPYPIFSNRTSRTQQGFRIVLWPQLPRGPGVVSRQSVTSRRAIARLGLAADKAETPATSEEDGWTGHVD